MRRHGMTLLVVAGVLVLVASGEAREKRREIRDASGNVIEVLGAAGRPRDLASGRPAGATKPAPPGRGLARRAPAEAECAALTGDERLVQREHQAEGLRVDRAISLLADAVCLEMNARTSVGWSLQDLMQLLQPAAAAQGLLPPGPGRCTPPPAPPPLR